jgi:hypothetical protein
MLLASMAAAAGCTPENGATAPETTPTVAGEQASVKPVRPTLAPPDGESLAQIAVPELTELSGLAASRAHPGIFWAHNDSGDTPRVFAFDQNGQPWGTFRLAGARAEDWEDMAVGPGPEEGTSYLYLGDIGDNFGRRPTVVVYRIEEPAPGTPGEVAIPGVEAVTLRYPKGETHDAEALMVDTPTGDLFVVTKSLSGQAEVYRAASPLTASAVDLEYVADVRLDGPATGADISADGTHIAIRTYLAAYTWERRAGENVAAALGGEPQRIALEFEPQGEAIAYSADGKALLTASEGPGTTLYRYALWR